ncbi:unnamed protein product [Prunus armeniaca]
MVLKLSPGLTFTQFNLTKIYGNSRKERFVWVTGCRIGYLVYDTSQMETRRRPLGAGRLYVTLASAISFCFSNFICLFYFIIYFFFFKATKPTPKTHGTKEKLWSPHEFDKQTQHQKVASP